MPGIDGLRAVAVLAVMLYHLKPQWLPGGFVGVDVFFVISGYVVTGSLVAGVGQRFGPYLMAFYGRRFRRILPAMVVCLLVSIAFVVAFVPNAWLSDAVQATSLAAFAGLSNFALLIHSDGYFAPAAEFNPFTHTWSLAVEEQFYLVYPLLMYAGLKATGARARSAFRGAFVALLLASLVCCALLSQRMPDNAYFMLYARYWELACGGGLFLARDRLSGWLRPAASAAYAGALMASGILLLAIALGFADRHAFPFPWAVPAVAGSMLVIAGLTRTDATGSKVAGWLASRPMVAVGLRSYSLYLWHWPVFAAFRWTVGLDTATSQAAALALTVAAAMASYAYVERPFKRTVKQPRPQGGRRALQPWQVVAAGIAGMGSGYLAAHLLYLAQPVLTQSVVMRHEADWYPHPALRSATAPRDRCQVAFTSRRVSAFGRVQEFVPTACDSPAVWPGRLFVVGDSHASAYRRLFHMVSAQTGIPISMYPAGGCAVASLLETLARRPAICSEFEIWALQQVSQRLQPGDVVLLASLRMRRLEPFTLAGAAAESNADDRPAAYAEAAAIAQRLSALGARVLFDAPKPVFRSPAFRCADWFNTMNAACVGGLSVPRQELDARRSDVMAALNEIQLKNPAVTVWDPLPVLCPGAICEAIHEGRPLYFDGDHLSGYANESLLPSFRAALSSALQSGPARHH